MNRLFSTMAAIGALAAAAPAAAQYDRQANVGVGLDGVEGRIAQLEARLQAGIQQGRISRREAIPLRLRLRELKRIEFQYGRDGLNGRERADLQQRIRGLRQELRVADGGGDRAYDRYDNDDGPYGRGDRVDRNRDGYDDRDIDRDGRWDDDEQGARVDRNRDGFDDRDFDRDGRWDDDDQNVRVDRNRDGFDDRDYDHDGRWDDDINEDAPTDDRSVVDRVIDNVAGGSTLRVGQRASSNLYGIPYEYRDRYRDDRDYYYRSDGNAIYQIDARTGTVARIHAMNR
jgi:hypothetical protein